MIQNESTKFAFAYSKTLPFQVADCIWQRWNCLSSWQDWDQSLSCAQAESNSIALGHQFCVVPRMSGQPIPVTVVSAVEGLHFTTASVGAMGLLSFGHTLILNTASQTVTLEHSICAVPVDVEIFRARIWDRLKEDVTASVEALGELAVKELEA